MAPVRLTRREFLAASAAFVAASCTGGKGKNGGSTSAGTLNSLKEGATDLSVLSPGVPVNPGPNSFGFALVTNAGAVVTGGSPQVWVAKDATSAAQGPFGAIWYPWAPASDFNDTSPRTDLPGTYAATVDISEIGNWIVGVGVTQGGKKYFGQAALPVTDEQLPAALGSKAISTKTPVATKLRALRMICTRTPPDPMHYISLDKALKNGKPTVVTFATPLLCESRQCGPVVDEVLLVFQKLGADKANFIHVEEFLPGEDFTPPPATEKNLSPAFKKWGFQDEPWTIIIDKTGIIRGRFGPGPVTAPQVEAAVQPLL